MMINSPLRRWTALLLLLLAAATPLLAAGPVLRTWNRFADFWPGTLENLSLDSRGRLTLAPAIGQPIDTGEPYVWDISSDPAGNLYLATGNAGKIFRIAANGDTSLFYQAAEPEIFALVHDGRSTLYAATSPNGAVYQIDPRGQARLFCQPGQNYIWDLQLDASGNLWIATGGKAQLLRVTPGGVVTTVLASEAEHLRCLIRDGDWLYAGSSRPGLIYRLGVDLKPFVLFDSGMEEVHALTVMPGGALYAATLAAAAPAASLAQLFGGQPAAEQGEDQEPAEEEENPDQPQPAAMLTITAAAAASQLLRIDAEGYGRNIWPLDQEEVHSLLAGGRGEIFVGTGRSGRLYSIDSAGEITLRQKTAATQISALHRTSSGGLVLGTSNMGLACKLEARSPSGRYEAESLDAAGWARWGVLRWRGAGAVTFQTRSGNTRKPEGSWSEWQSLLQEGEVWRVVSPPARFLQWRCELKNGGEPPRLEEVTLSWQQKNEPPEITQVVILPAGEFYDTAQEPIPEGVGLVAPPPLPKGEQKPGYRSAVWEFNDPNQDPLLFTLWYRRMGQDHWRRLAGPLARMVHSWESRRMADGEYELKVTAADSLSLPAGLGLKAERVSAPFIIDNTGPEIRDLKFSRDGSGRTLEFSVCDARSAVGQVRISCNAAEWQLLYPRDGICDSFCEQFTVPLPPGAGLEITIEAMDLLENRGLLHHQLKGF